MQKLVSLYDTTRSRLHTAKAWSHRECWVGEPLLVGGVAYRALGTASAVKCLEGFSLFESPRVIDLEDED